MTNEEAIANINMIRVAFVDPVTKEQRKLIDDTLDTAIKALEQQPCEDEYIRVPKKALKYRTAGMVAYNAKWLKKHWQMELKVMGIECDDVVSREDAEECKELMTDINGDTVYVVRMSDIRQLPSVTQKSGHCKECKYFEYDSVAKVDGMPLIVAHEICNKWGNGCKTSEDGYCYLFEPQEREEE